MSQDVADKLLTLLTFSFLALIKQENIMKPNRTKTLNFFTRKQIIFTDVFKRDLEAFCFSPWSHLSLPIEIHFCVGHKGQETALETKRLKMRQNVLLLFKESQNFWNFSDEYLLVVLCTMNTWWTQKKMSIENDLLLSNSCLLISDYNTNSAAAGFVLGLSLVLNASSWMVSLLF